MREVLAVAAPLAKQARRWRLIAVRVLAVACFLALLQGLLYYSFNLVQRRAAADPGQQHLYHVHIAGHVLTLAVSQVNSSESSGLNASSSAVGSTNGGIDDSGAAEHTNAERPVEQLQQQNPADSASPAARQQGHSRPARSDSSGSGGSSTAGLTCQESGLCSLGKVRHWRGDVATNEQLRAMLEAVAYKREVRWGLPRRCARVVCEARTQGGRRDSRQGSGRCVQDSALPALPATPAHQVMFVTTGMPTNPYVVNIVEDARALGARPTPSPTAMPWQPPRCGRQLQPAQSMRGRSRCPRCALAADRCPPLLHTRPGLGHIVVLVWDEGKCGELPEPYRDAISCVWDSRRSLESANPFNDLLAKRW